MIRVALVEDDAHDREEVRQCLKRYETETRQKFAITEFSDGEDIVTGYKASYDLILLDVEMAFLDGMKTAARIREMDTQVIIIFITNMPQYAIQGYKVNALDYILKPVSYFSFSESLSRALRHISVSEKKYVTVTVRGGKVKIDMSKLCYVEVQDHLLIYHTTDGKYVAKGTIREAADGLDDRFCLCNRCYLVNLEHVENYQGSEVNVNGDMIQVSRGRRKPFMDALNQYLNEVKK